MEHRFDGKRVVVTGATSGIGLEAARLFTARGAQVTGTGRDPARLASLGREVHRALPLDVTDPASVARFADEVGPVDVLVNNAGVGLFKAWDETSMEAFDHVLDVNLRGVVRLCTALLPRMLERGEGVVLNVASVAGERGYPKHTAYCASKHALIGYSRSLRKDLRGTGVDVVVVCPPAVRTPFFENAGYMTFDEDHPGLELMTAQTVAKGIVEAAAKRPQKVVLGRRAKVLWALDTFAPGLVDGLQRAKA